jgi:hypothetical protein
MTFSKKQAESIALLAKNDRHKWQGARGTGKTYKLVGAGIWWVLCWDGMVLVTAPKWSQIEDVYFGQLKMVLYNSKIAVTGDWNSDRENGVHKADWTVAPSTDPFKGIFGINASDSARVKGYHNKRTMVIVKYRGLPLRNGLKGIARHTGKVRRFGAWMCLDCRLLRAQSTWLSTNGGLKPVWVTYRRRNS